MSTKRLNDRFEFVTERGALLQLLAELKNNIGGFDDVGRSLCEAIPTLRKFLTQNEIVSKLDGIVVQLDSFSSFRSFGLYLGKFSKNSFADSKIVLNWIKILSEKKLEATIRESLKVGSEDDFGQQRYNEFILSIITLPDRISNCRAMATNEEEHNYVKDCSRIVEERLVESVKTSLKQAYSKVGVSNCVNLRSIAFLVAKGRNMNIENSTLLESIVSWICSQNSENDDMKWDRVAQRIFTDESYGSREYEALVTSLVLNSENVEELERCFGTAVKSSEILKRVVFVKLLFQHTLDQKILKNLLDYIGRCGKEEALPELLENSIKAWSNTAFVPTSTIERHKHTTRLILYILHLLRSNKSINWHTVFLTVSDGVQARLSNTDLQIRQTGMFVGETISKYNSVQMKNIDGVVETEEEKKKYLNFDYEEDDWIEEMRGIVDNGISNSDLPTSSGIFHDVKNELHENIEKIQLSNIKNEEKIDLDSDDDEDFPIYDVAREEKVFEKLTENQEPLRKAEPPRYINDAFEQLLEKEKYEVFETSLLTLESLIRRNAIGFSAIAPTLVARLVFLDDRFSTPDFENIRKQCVVACLVVKPEIVARIVQLMLGSDCSMCHRFLILDCIRTAAKELGQPTELISDCKKNSSGNEKVSNGNWKDVVEARIQSNTRRFTKKRNEVVFLENRLGKVVNHFFYPLLVESTGEHLELLGRDSALMSKIVFTLADILQNAGLSPKLPDMAVNLIRYISPHRFSEDQYVRIAVTFAYCSVVDLVPVVLLESYFDSSVIAEWARWASQVSENDEANEHERKLAQCLLTELWKKMDSKSE